MVTIDEGGVGRFRVFLPGARQVQLVGDFTGWQHRPVAMRHGVDGWWSADVALPEGDRSFQYLIDGSVWVPDYAAQGLERNQFGTWVSLLHVQAAPVPAASLPFQPRGGVASVTARAA